MLSVLFVSAGVVGLAMILFAFRKASRFRLAATVMRWLTFELEVQASGNDAIPWDRDRDNLPAVAGNGDSFVPPRSSGRSLGGETAIRPNRGGSP